MIWGYFLSVLSILGIGISCYLMYPLESKGPAFIAWIVLTISVGLAGAAYYLMDRRDSPTYASWRIKKFFNGQHIPNAGSLVGRLTYSFLRILFLFLLPACLIALFIFSLYSDGEVSTRLPWSTAADMTHWLGKPDIQNGLWIELLGGAFIGVIGFALAEAHQVQQRRDVLAIARSVTFVLERRCTEHLRLEIPEKGDIPDIIITSSMQLVSDFEGITRNVEAVLTHPASAFHIRLAIPIVRLTDYLKNKTLEIKELSPGLESQSADSARKSASEISAFAKHFSSQENMDRFRDLAFAIG
ncbi:hypothetical protein [Hyphococcus sp. DH-69]|uniref:hypothetical protein n=1 Tax=Hyphococcus formosus TaxID=3143534 RepID=UPI00398B0BC4